MNHREDREPVGHGGALLGGRGRRKATLNYMGDPVSKNQELGKELSGRKFIWHCKVMSSNPSSAERE